MTLSLQSEIDELEKDGFFSSDKQVFLNLDTDISSSIYIYCIDLNVEHNKYGIFRCV